MLQVRGGLLSRSAEGDDPGSAIRPGRRSLTGTELRRSRRTAIPQQHGLGTPGFMRVCMKRSAR